MMNAQEALRVGLVSEVVDRDELDDYVWSLANTISKLPPASTELNKPRHQLLLRVSGHVPGPMSTPKTWMYVSYAASPEDLPKGLQDVDRVTAEQGDARRFPVHERGLHGRGPGHRCRADGASQPRPLKPLAMTARPPPVLNWADGRLAASRPVPGVVGVGDD